MLPGDVALVRPDPLRQVPRGDVSPHSHERLDRFVHIAGDLDTLERLHERTDLQVAARSLARKLKQEFKPDIILSPSARGGIIAFFLRQDISENIPIFVGVCQWRKSDRFEGNMSSFSSVETENWQIYVPSAILDNKDKNILILDDFAMTGDTLRKMKELLVGKGVSEDNIRTMAVVATKVAILGNKGPNYQWLEVDSPSFYFPWGEAR